MQLQGRNLSQGMTGDDVLLLKIELYLLGFEHTFPYLGPGHVPPPRQPAVDAFDTSTETAVREMQARNNLSATGVVDEATARCIDAAVQETGLYAVFGQVFGPDGEPLPGIKVELLERDLPSLEVEGPRVLAGTQTGLVGYLIPYTAKQFAESEALPPAPDVQVRLPEILDEEGGPVTSSIAYNAPRIQIIDVHLDQGQGQQVDTTSEFERYVGELEPLVGDIPIANLREDEEHHDLTFLNGETGISVEHLRFLRAAYERFTQTQVAPEAFYALFRQGLPTELRRLLAVKPTRLREALEASIAQNIVPRRLEGELENTLESLRDLAVAASFEQPDAGEPPGLGQLVQTTALPSNLQMRFVDFALSRNGEADFWEKLSREPGFEDKVAIQDLQFTIGAFNAFAGKDLAILEQIQSLKLREGWTRLSDAVNATLGQWVDAVHSPARGFALYRRVEEAFPGAFFRARLLEDSDLGNGDLVRFLEANPDFDIYQDVVDSETDLGHVHDRDGLAIQLQNLQAAARLVPDAEDPYAPNQGRFATGRALILNGYSTSLSILNAGEREFMDTMTPIVGEAHAARTFENVQAQAAATQIILEQARDYLNTPSMPVLPEGLIDLDTTDETSWRAILGSRDGCACEHCRSIYSPSAYMVDLLEFLKDAPSSTSPLEVLTHRRPDLRHIKLNCTNANTTLPYIDLVNEILEEAISPIPEVPVPARNADSATRQAYDRWIERYQTPAPNRTSQAALEQQLRAEPAHEHTPTYEDLADARYPWNLPFSNDHEKISLFSRHLGLKLAEIRELFERDENQIARDILGLSQAEWDILAREDTNNVDSVWGLRLPEPLEVTALESVNTFMERTGLSYEELEALAATRFLSGVLTEMRIEKGVDPCDIDTFRIRGLRDRTGAMDARVLDQIHRFMRLWHRLGWSLSDLDGVLGALGHSAIDASALLDMADVLRVAREFRVSVAALAEPGASRLADVLRRTEREVVMFAALLGIDDVDALDLQQRLLLLEKWRAVRSSGLGVDELAYILHGRDQTPPAFSPMAEEVELFLRSLHTAVSEHVSMQLAISMPEIEADVAEYADTLDTSLSDDERSRLLTAFRAASIEDMRERLATAIIVPNTAQYLSLSIAVVERLVVALDETTGSLIEAQSTIGAGERASAIEDLLHFCLELPILPPEEWPRQEWESLLDSSDLDSVFVVDSLSEARAYFETIIDSYVNVDWLLRRLDRVARLLRGLDIDRRILDAITETQVENNFLDLNQIRAPHDPPDLLASDTFEQWQALVTARDIQHQLPRSDHDLFDFLVYSATSEGSLFAYVNEHTGWNTDPQTGAPAGVLEPLVRNLERLGPSDPIDLSLFRSVDFYARLNKAMRWMRRWRISPQTLALWGDPNPDRSDELVGSLRETARARCPSDERWYEIMTPMMDELRERKRDALLAFLIHHHATFRTPADVYTYYLIDPEMSSCMLTSRIKQANAAIQLFVQRVQMNLEDDLRPSESRAVAWQKHWQQWEWMENYRVWEANRKVFLYPENWIEPELRNNKSPFFRELEEELLQNEITPASIENAYRNYLRKLDDVARLDIRSIYLDENTGILYVIGRSFSEPWTHYFRQRNAAKIWSPWERLDLDIESDHLILTSSANRLLLFWAVMVEETVMTGETEGDGEGHGTTDDGESDETRFLKIDFKWSEHKDGRWAPVKQSKYAKLKYELRPQTPIRTGWRTAGLLPYESADNIHFKATVVENEGIDIWMFGRFTHRIAGSTGFGDSARYPTRDDSFDISVAKFHFEECKNELYLDLQQDEVRFYVSPSPVLKSAYHAMDIVDLSGEGNIAVYYNPAPWEIEDYTRPFGEPGLNERFLDRILTTEEFEELTRDVEAALVDLEASVVDNMRLISSSVSGYSYALFSGAPAYGWKVVTSPVLSTYIRRPFVIQTSPATYLISPYSDEIDWWGRTIYRFHAETMYHPYVCVLIEALNKSGIDGLLKPPTGSSLDRQLASEDKDSTVFKSYGPNERNLSPFMPVEQIDFSLLGAYSLYNWELFFHIPLLVAERLRANQQFADAQKWFHAIFDPTDTSPYSTPARFWKVKPFFDRASQPLTSLEELLRPSLIARESIHDQVDAWRHDPFSPHHIARLRITAYMRTTVMKYIDNLVDWADSNFRLDTMETLNEAAQLYVLAAQMLGEKPTTIPAQEGEEITYAIFQESARFAEGNLSTIWTKIESMLPPRSMPTGNAVRFGGSSIARSLIPIPNRIQGTRASLMIRYTPYFCIPDNDMLLSYWDTVADRLFKIRNCMNIEGQIRALPLYEPPIDPALLVRARALGLSLQQILSFSDRVGAPNYRYQTLAQKALEFCREVRNLGGILLSALEKQDAEALSLLRTRHELTMLRDIRRIKSQQVKEAYETLQGLEEARRMAETRFEFYASQESMTPFDRQKLAHMTVAHILESAGQILELAAAAAHMAPDVTVGPAGGSTHGGSHVGRSLHSFAGTFGYASAQFGFMAELAAVMGEHHRREEEREFQEELAHIEIEQLEKQQEASRIRHAIAEYELENHDKQAEQAKEIEEFMRSKFTNEQLYGWMTGQLATLYRQAYQMAYQLARKAEQAARYELGVSESEFMFIDGGGYWDSLKKGLVSGDRLYQDLSRMDLAFMERNQRELELTKHISLAMLDPLALIHLKETGECFINLPEAIFDLDYPGHYMRRIKSVSLTIPCVTGPYTGVHCTLTLRKHQVRRGPSLGSDPQLTHGAVESIATSSGQTDSGLFELNFRDERYLPFEGAGAVSTWRLELSGKWRTQSGELVELPQFDFDTISDVIFHINYTARNGAVAFRDEVTLALRDAMNSMVHDLAESRTGLLRLFSLRHEFPNEWHQFLYGESDHSLTLKIDKAGFPFMFQRKGISVKGIDFFLKPAAHEDGYGAELSFSHPGGSPAVPVLGPALGQLPGASIPEAIELGDWTLQLTTIPEGLQSEEPDTLDPEKVEDLFLVCHYSIGASE